MTAGKLVEGALRRERVLVIGCLLFVMALSWAYLLSGAGMMEEMGDMLMPMSSGPWTPGHALLVLAMWAVMMAAMMLPSAAPMILLHATLARRQGERGAPAAASGAVAAGYLAVWAAFSLAATALPCRALDRPRRRRAADRLGCRDAVGRCLIVRSAVAAASTRSTRQRHGRADDKPLHEAGYARVLAVGGSDAARKVSRCPANSSTPSSSVPARPVRPSPRAAATRV